MKTKVTITGIADVNEILFTITPREAKNLLRVTITDMAKQLAKEAAAIAPRDRGNLAAAIGYSRKKGSKTTVEAQVEVDRSAYYWRFLEYGDGPDGVEHAFFLRAAKAMEMDLERIYLEAFGRKLTARLKRLRK